MIIRTNFVILSLASAVVSTLTGCSSGKAASSSEPLTITGLQTVQAQLKQVPQTISATGTVHATETATLSAQITGRIVTIPVREGDSVHAGQTLLTLDSAQIRSEIDRAQAAVTAAEQEMQIAQTDASLAAATLKRYQLLRDRKSVSPQEFDEIERRAEAANARVDYLRAQMTAAGASAAGAHTTLGYTRLQAPFDGVITARHVDPGTLASPGVPLLEVEKSGRLQVFVTIDESILRNLQTGTPVDVEIAALAVPILHARVAQIVPAADPSSHSFLVKLDLPATAGLRAGMFGMAKIKTGSRSVLLVPQTALISHGSLNAIWVSGADRIAALRYVTTGEKYGIETEILSGLSTGDTVVLAPGDRELNGKRIEVHP